MESEMSQADDPIRFEADFTTVLLPTRARTRKDDAIFPGGPYRESA